MALNLPRVSLVISDTEGVDAQGELTTLSLGYGLHQAWIYTAMFGTTTIFPAPTLPGIEGLPISLVFVISIIVFALTLLFAGVTDQRLLKFYTSKRSLAAAAVIAAAGTAAILGTPLPGAAGMAALAFSSVATGFGSALLLLFWGSAYARGSAGTIVVNTAVAVAVAIIFYALSIYVIPQPVAAALVICLPLLELPLLWKLTPVSYAVRHAVPIFNPLPVKKGLFSVRFAIPVLLFGLALGLLRSLSTQVILPSQDPSAHLFALTIACLATIVVLIALFYLGRKSRWESLFRLLVPMLLAGLFFVPMLLMGDTSVSSTVLLVSFMCFEALMWIFFSELCQEFRLSPVYVFGIGRGCLALGSLLGALLLANRSILGSFTSFGETGAVMVAMFALVLAYVLLPRVSDIRHAIVPHLDSPEYNRLNDMAELFESEQPGSTGAATGGTVASANYPRFNSAEALANIDAFTEGRAEGAGATQGEDDPRDGRKAAETAGAAAQEGTPSSTDTDAAEATASAPAKKRRGRPRKNGSGQSGEAQRRSGRFRTRCEMIADEFLLSRRETEVLFLLAKGHNAAYIQKKLYITLSTTKTHIYHIYQKLGIHTQQELLAMVSDAQDDDNQSA